MKALITGGTGTLRRLVVPRLRDAGGDIRVLSRHRPEVTEGIEYVMLLPVWLPGKAAAAIRAGANLAPERAVGRRTWDDFLAEREFALRR